MTVRALLIGMCLLLAGCATVSKPVHSGSTVDSMELLMLWGGVTSSTHYAVVRAESIPAIHAEFTRVLARQGLSGWNPRFDCVRMASLWIAVAQSMFATGNGPGQSLALAEVWYPVNGGNHAAVAARTDHGVVFIEPQTGEVSTDARRPYFVKW